MLDCVVFPCVNPTYACYQSSQILMRYFLLTVTLYGQLTQDHLQCDIVREQMKVLGLQDYLVNDADERIALPDNIYADWVEGENCDSIIAEWNLKIAEVFRSNNLKGCSFITVGADAVWQSQCF